MEKGTRYVTMTISSSEGGRELSDRMMDVLSRWLKKPTSAIRSALETKRIKIAKVQLTEDLEKIIESLKKRGLDVVVGPHEDNTAARTGFDVSVGTTGRIFSPKGPQYQTEWKKGEVIEGLYEVLGSAAGGMGKVYFVFHRLWKMMLAIKTPLAMTVTSEARMRRFMREAELWVNLGLHPNIATCYYARVIEGLPRLFIEYVDGGTLDEWHERKRLNDLRLIADLMLQFCHGMMYAEEKGFIHRDIKPANCLIGKNRILKVTDFGLVKRVDNPLIGSDDDDSVTDRTASQRADDRLTMFEGGVIGSPWYMAPERFKENSKEDIRSDIYSFGVMLYEIVLHEMPFSFPNGFSLTSLVRSHLRAKPVDPLSLRPDLPRSLVRIMLTCLEKKPENRYQSFLQLCLELEALNRELRPGKEPRQRPNVVGLKADSLNNQAVSLLDLGRAEEARALFEEAYSADTEHLEAVYNLHTLRWEATEISDQEVINRMESLKIEVRESSDYAHLMGLIALQRGDPALAVTLLEKARTDSTYYQDRWTANGSDPREFVKSLGLTPVGELASFAGHIKTVRSVSFSPGALRAFSVGEDRSIRVWDVGSGRCLKNLRTFTFVPVTGAFSPDGTLAVTAYGDVFKTLDLWDMDRGALRLRYQGMGVLSVCFSSDSSQVAAFGAGGRVRIVETASERIVLEFQDESGRLSSMAFLDNGKSLALGREDGTVSIRDLASGKEIRRIAAHHGAVSHLEAAADGRRFLSCSEDETVRQWDTPTGIEIRRFAGHHGTVNDARFTPDGAYIVTASADGTIKVWSASTGRCCRTLVVPKEDLTCCAISSDGKHVLSGGAKGSVRLWALALGWFGAAFLEPAVCRPKTFEELAGLYEAFSLAVEEFQTAWHRPDKAQALEVFERMRAMSGFCWSSEAISLRGVVAERATRGRLKSASFVRSFRGHGDAVTAVSASNDSMRLLTGSLDGTAIVWDVVTGRSLKRFQVGSPVRTAVFIPNSWKILTLSQDNVLRTWDGDATILKEIRGVIAPVRLTADGKHVVGISQENTPVRIDLETAELTTWGASVPGCEFVCFSGNMESLFSLKDGRRILRWASSTGRNEGALRDLGMGITALLPDATLDVVGAGTDTGEIALYIGGAGVNVSLLRGHEAAVRVLCASGDGELWLSGSDDCSLKVWDISKERCMATLEGHSSPVRSAGFFPNSFIIASGSADGSVRLWGLEWEFLLI